MKEGVNFPLQEIQDIKGDEWKHMDKRISFKNRSAKLYPFKSEKIKEFGGASVGGHGTHVPRQTRNPSTRYPLRTCWIGGWMWILRKCTRLPVEHVRLLWLWRLYFFEI